MRKLLFLVALGIIGAGQVKADSACVADTYAHYATAGFTCNIGGVLDFSLFSGSPTGVTASGPGTSPFTTSQVEITPVNGPGGVGLDISFPGGDQALSTGVRDVDLPFEVKCLPAGTNCLSNVFMTIVGTTTGSATDV